MSTSEIEDNFNFAVEQIRNSTSKNSKLTDAIKLKFYALYKQATVGKCNTAQPWAYQIVDRSKWDAWNELDNMSKETAMTKYCELFVKYS
jgi:acyl-CoA-binding protein